MYHRKVKTNYSYMQFFLLTCLKRGVGEGGWLISQRLLIALSNLSETTTGGEYLCAFSSLYI